MAAGPLCCDQMRSCTEAQRAGSLKRWGLGSFAGREDSAKCTERTHPSALRGPAPGPGRARACACAGPCWPPRPMAPLRTATSRFRLAASQPGAPRLGVTVELFYRHAVPCLQCKQSTNVPCADSLPGTVHGPARSSLEKFHINYRTLYWRNLKVGSSHATTHVVPLLGERSLQCRLRTPPRCG